MRTLHDLRFGLRVLRRNPGFTAVAVLTLALGIAVNATVFGWIDAVLLRPLPGVRAVDELAVIENTTSTGEYMRCSYPDYRDYRDSLKFISGVTGIFGTTLRIGEDRNAQDIWGELVTGNFFDVLGAAPYLGRFFTPEESADPPASFTVAVISYRLWQTRFRGDPRAVGKSVRVNGLPLTIVGVAAPGFQGSMVGVVQDFWAPITLIDRLNRSTPKMLDNRNTRNQILIARLKPGLTFEQARAEAVARARALSIAYPKSNEGIGLAMMPVAESHTAGAQALLRKPLHILIGVCALVLLIACANVGNLLLARATARQKEFAIRLSLGAPRGRLARQLLTETVVLAGAGAVLGILLVPWIAGTLFWLLPPVNVPVHIETTPNVRVFVCTALLAVLSAMVSGLAPLACSLRSDLNSVLKEGGRSEETGARAHRMRGLLVIAEVALAAVALVGAGLFAKSFQSARKLNPGFDTSHVLVARFNLANTGRPVEQQLEFCRRLRLRLEAAAGVEAVNYADTAPLGFEGGTRQDIGVAGYAPAKNGNLLVYRALIAPGHFGLLHIPIVEGRDFTDRDDADAPPVVIVNQAFARRYFGGANPVGRSIRAWGTNLTVVGMVKDVKFHSLSEAPPPYFYAPFRQYFRTGHTAVFYVRTAGDPAALAKVLRREAAAIDPNVSVHEAMPLVEYTAATLYPLKVAASLLAVLGVLAVLLAAVGLYSVMAYAVVQRTHEVGIRMALGAQPGSVLKMVMRQGLELTGAGLMVGVPAALAAARLAGGMLIGVGVADPVTFIGASLFLALVALAASYLPARRATRLDPMAALRCQ